MLGMEYRKELGGAERGILGTRKNQPFAQKNSCSIRNEGPSSADLRVAPLSSAGERRKTKQNKIKHHKLFR